MAAWYADDKGFRMGEEGRIILNDPERQAALEKMDEVISSGANLGDFSQNGHYAEISKLNASYDEHRSGLTNTIDTTPSELKDQKDRNHEILLSLDRQEIEHSQSHQDEPRMGDFSQKGSDAEVAKLDSSYGEDRSGLTNTIDTTPSELKDQRA